MKIKPYLRHFIKALLKKLAALELWLDRSNLVNPYAFDDLSPIDNVDKAEVYDEALSWAIKNKRIKNIAVTGPYGSGKSSILKTFEKKHPGYHYLNISLASFQDEMKTDENGGKVPIVSNSEDMHRLIELSILQQMFYRVKGSKIPDSRFNRIKNLSTWRIMGFSCFTVLLLLSFIIIFYPTFLTRFSWYEHLNKQHSDWIIYSAIFMAIPALFKILTYVLRVLNNSKFNKINLTKGEVEFDPRSETSVLNKHLDEILYFFEVMHYNVVVIEDLDRFNDPEIFTKLREINILINKSLQINRHIPFIYAIKDDMFKDKTRTKFFDFIVPVIPVINWSNSFEIMLDKFKQKELKLLVSENFISAITLYIDDMRALKNIFNEFMLYKENLKDISPNQDKLLAVIVYKNIYPSDFAELHENKGIIYDVFQKKPALTKSVIETKQALIEKNKNRMAEFKETLATNILELRAIYLLAFQKRAQQANGILINSVNRSFADIQQSDEYFDWLTTQSVYYYNVYTSPWSNTNYTMQRAQLDVPFNTIEKEINDTLTYRDRYQLMQGENIAEIEDLTHQNAQAEREIGQMKAQSLKELLAEKPDEINAFDPKFTKEKLLVYLVREGFIDENYPSLISYFYEGSLSYGDMVFILSIRNREKQDFGYKLDMVANVIKRLEIEDFSRDNILNFQLIDYLINNRSVNEEALNRIKNLLANQSPASLKFIDEYIGDGTLEKEFFSLLFTSWPGLWDYIYDNTTYPPDNKDEYLITIIDYADDGQLRELNKNHKLDKYIKSLPDFLTWFNLDDEFKKVKNLIKLFNIKFYKLIDPEGSPELFDYIIDNQNYVLTEDMIRLIIEQKGAEEAKVGERITTANYTAVRDSAFQPLIDYVEQNLSDYIENVTLLLPKNTKDTEEYVLDLLNKESLSEDIKNRLIDKEEVKIAAIKNAPQELWVKLLSADKIVVNWPNILSYYEVLNAIDEPLLNYLNLKPVYALLSKSKINVEKVFPEALTENFTRVLLQENLLTDEAFESLIESSPYYFPNGLEIDNLSDRKVKTLIIKRTIRLTTTMFQAVRTHFSSLIGLLIEKNFDDYIKAPAEFPLDIADLVHLLKSSLTDSQKVDLIPQVNQEWINDENEIAGLYSGLLLKNNPIENISTSTIIRLLTFCTTQQRPQLFDKYYSKLGTENVISLLPSLGNKFNNIGAGNEPIVMQANDVNISISKKLKQAGIIADWKSKKDELSIYNNVSSQEEVDGGSDL